MKSAEPGPCSALTKATTSPGVLSPSLGLLYVKKSQSVLDSELDYFPSSFESAFLAASFGSLVEPSSSLFACSFVPSALSFGTSAPSSSTFYSFSFSPSVSSFRATLTFAFGRWAVSEKKLSSIANPLTVGLTAILNVSYFRRSSMCACAALRLISSFSSGLR